MGQPSISICIPAYKRAQHLKRLLESIADQDYRDFEVILTDDSPDNEVAGLCNEYTDKFPLTYHRNPSALGTPANWNSPRSPEWTTRVPALLVMRTTASRR